jgi:hypothetical protein
LIAHIRAQTKWILNARDVIRSVAARRERVPAGRWRRECSQHSQRSIARFLEGRCERFEFEEVVMGVEIPPDASAPHTNVWTFKDEHGRIHITNGTHLVMEKTLLTVYL